MPGLVVFGRRWSVGSDDLVVPALFLCLLHGAWFLTLVVIITQAQFILSIYCSEVLRWIVLAYLAILCGCILMEGIIAFVSTRGSIIVSTPRDSMHHLLYIRLGLMILEIVWVILSIIWLSHNYDRCAPESAMKSVLGLVVCCLMMTFSLLVAMWCTFDIAGRKWVRMKRFQESLKDKRSLVSKRSSNIRRNWRQRYDGHIGHMFLYQLSNRKAIRAYEASWDKRFNLLCCCMKSKGNNKNSITEIAQLFTEFFRDLDVVPSDVIAGLVLLRKHQKMRMKYTVVQDGNDIYEYLSGIAITPRTKFLSLRQATVVDNLRIVIHYMKFALAAYGWPIYVVSQGGLGICTIMPRLSCFCCIPCAPPHPRAGELISDNCCHCNYAAMTKLINLGPHDVIYTTYHSDVGKTPFYIALDHVNRNVVVAIRGTLSLYDVLTDLKADCEPIPVEPIREDWYGHKGIILNAVYIQRKLREENILNKAFQCDPQKGTDTYGLALLGHSLGAGTAAILAVLLRQQYPHLKCYAFSPPGGLMSLACVEDTKDFITSVVLGKDVIPRVGLHQMELLRTDLINVIKQSDEPKWQIIGQKLLCCCTPADLPPSMAITEMKEQLDKMKRDVTAHPIDSDIGLSAHPPLFPPGRIIHIVRNHPKQKRECCESLSPVYQAIWAETSDFDEVLISPTMINDHMPDKVLEALEKTLLNVGPAKPTRILTESERKDMLEQATPLSSDEGAPKNLLEEILLEEDRHPSVSAIPQITANGCPANVTWDETTQGNVKYGSPDSETTRLRLDFVNEWMGNAPLATPEALSASSSVIGINRSGSGFGTRDRLRLSGEMAQRNRIHDKKDETSAERSGAGLRSCAEEGDDSGAGKRRKHVAIVTAEVVVETEAECPVRNAEGGSGDVGEDSAGVEDTSTETKPLLYDSPKRSDDRLKYIDDTSGTESPEKGAVESVDAPQVRPHVFQSVKSRKSNDSPSNSPRAYHRPLTHTESDSFLKHLAGQMTMHRSKQEDNIARLTETSPLASGPQGDAAATLQGGDDSQRLLAVEPPEEVKMCASRSDSDVMYTQKQDCIT